MKQPQLQACVVTNGTHTILLIVDDFGLKYVRKQDADHLASVLKKHRDISQDWEGNKFAGIDLDCNYATKHCDRTCCLSMKFFS